MKLSYREGTWFAVPLRQGGFAVGLVARATGKGKVILCYFFGPRGISLPTLADVEQLTQREAIRVLRAGDLSLIRHEWPIIGESMTWKRSAWPMPPFVRRDLLTRKAWRVYHSDTDPNLMDREEPERYESTLEKGVRQKSDELPYCRLFWLDYV